MLNVINIKKKPHPFGHSMKLVIKHYYPLPIYNALAKHALIVLSRLSSKLILTFIGGNHLKVYPKPCEIGTVK